MIRRYRPDDFDAVYTIINDAAEAYRSVIPADRWHQPYMPREALQQEIDAGVMFSLYVDDDSDEILGVMGLQDVQDVTLIRHAYVRTVRRQQGIGGQLLAHLLTLSERSVLIGTWAAAEWAIRFYQKHGFRQVSESDKNRLLQQYWNIPERQIETSVVLADPGWWQLNDGG